MYDIDADDNTTILLITMRDTGDIADNNAMILLIPMPESNYDTADDKIS